MAAGATWAYSFWTVKDSAASACFKAEAVSRVSVLFEIYMLPFLLIMLISSLAFKSDPVMLISSLVFMFILLTFVKKTQKTPKSILNLAEQRLKEFKDENR